ncbi:hypothetical protein L596_025566 [Steinernema carpocapsae]|uniref:Uncharacterized protein n=1 Tax=Steinernema carpocapsae TaxID=34508 RepID=A0A4U5M8C1_STECR|nr:hypothetical protein L596_025566 [Steinernema carpocapsae]
MEFTPFQFIDEVLLDLITTNSKERTSPHDASLLPDLPTYWGEQATRLLLGSSYFDLTIYYCHQHEKFAYFFEGSLTVSVCPETNTFLRDASTFLRNVTLTDECLCSRHSEIQESTIFSALSDYMSFTGLMPHKATINFEHDFIRPPEMLTSIMMDNFWAHEIHLKFSSPTFSANSDRFIHRHLNNNVLRSFEIVNCDHFENFLKGTVTSLMGGNQVTNVFEIFKRTHKEDIRKILQPFFQNAFFKTLKFDTWNGWFHVKTLITAWISSQERENCTLSACIGNEHVTMQEMMADMPRKFGVVTCHQRPVENNSYVITVAGCDKHLAVQWQIGMKDSLNVRKF